MPSIFQFVVTSDEELLSDASWNRIDRYLALQLPTLSRSRLQKLIEQGEVSVNEQPCYAKKTLLKESDRLRVRVPDAIPLDLEPEPIPLDILYEDEHLLMVNKPAGLVVHPAPGHPSGTLVNALLAHCDRLAGIGGIQRPGIVHRLDKDTSGVMVVAKTDQAHQHLQAQIKAKTAQRDYLAVIYGVLPEATGTIDLPIGRHRGDRKKMAVISLEHGGRAAKTHWVVKERLGNYSLVQFRLETGRTHQIRVHTTHLGHPVVGDPVYSTGRSVGVNLQGQALHAWQLRLQHPVSGRWIERTAEPPDHFQTLLKTLRRRS